MYFMNSEHNFCLGVESKASGAEKVTVGVVGAGTGVGEVLILLYRALVMEQRAFLSREYQSLRPKLVLLKYQVKTFLSFLQIWMSKKFPEYFGLSMSSRDKLHNLSTPQMPWYFKVSTVKESCGSPKYPLGDRGLLQNYKSDLCPE